MMLANAARHIARRQAPTAARGFASLEQFQDYGKGVFAGKVADDYLSKHGGSGDILKDPTWVATHADIVADAVFDW
jgi:glutamine synthetase